MSDPNTTTAGSIRTGRRTRVRALTVTAMLSAIAFVLMFLDFAVPFMPVSYTHLEAPGPLVRGLPACSVPLLAAAAAAAAAGRAGGVRLLPKLLRHGSPILGIGDGLVGQMLHRFGRLGVGGMGAGLVDDLADLLRVLQHGAGAQHVVVEGLAVMIGHKQRGLQALQQLSLIHI